MKANTIRFKDVILILIIPALLLPARLLSQQPELINKVYAKDVEGIRKLIDQGADLNVREEFYSMTPLLVACNSNYVEVARVLIEGGADIHAKASNGGTALLFAAMHSKELTELLLARGADITARSDNGSGVFTNCTMGIISGRVDYDLAELLLAKGAQVDEANTTEYYGGYTPLFWAVDDNNQELVSFLIEHGAHVNTTAANGKTPLTLAREGGYEAVAEILRSHGAR
jgi:ankyrin repeat protein